MKSNITEKEDTEMEIFHPLILFRWLKCPGWTWPELGASSGSSAGSWVRSGAARMPGGT